MTRAARRRGEFQSAFGGYRRIAAFLLLIGLVYCFWVPVTYAIGVAPMQIFEVDNATQTGRVHTFSMVFKQGDIADCAVPLFAGLPLDTASYQCDKKTQWPDGSLQRAVITFIKSQTALEVLQFTYQSGVGNNTGYLDKAGMIAFNGGNWNGQILVTANSQTYTWDAKAMLTALSIGAGQIEYWQQGPVVTTVRVWDVTAAYTYFRGWHLDTGVMNDCSGAICATTSNFASQQGYFDLRFIPSKGIVEMDIIDENQSTTRGQDQIYDLEIKTDNGSGSLVSRYTKSAFRHISRTNWRKTFTSGTAQGHTRIDWNFPYLISTGLFANFDQRSLVTSTVAAGAATEYTSFIASDMGDLGGHALMIQEYPDNNEGALEQKETLRYLYLMGTASSVAAAKAWDIATGEVDAVNGLTGVTGGAGYWNILQNVPFHSRETRTPTTEKYYCPGIDSANATPATACGGSVSPLGRTLSRDAYPTDLWLAGVVAVSAVGDVTLGGWNINEVADHWLDYSYVPCLLLGSRYHCEELYAASGIILTSSSPTKYGINNGIFAYQSAGDSIFRAFVWGELNVGKAVIAATDGTPEKAYFLSKLNSNLRMQEGFMGITGTALTPTSPNATCTMYDAATANSWDYARCTVGQNVATGLHAMSRGFCPADAGDAATFVDPTKATDSSNNYFDSFAGMGLGFLIDMGFTQAGPILQEGGKLLVEKLLNPAFIPYLIATEASGLRNGVGSCTLAATTNAYFTTLAQMKDAYLSSVVASATSFTAVTGNFPCDPKSYDVLARGSATFIKARGVNSGSYTGAAAFAFMDASTPYFGNGCGGSGDAQLKFALQPRGGLTGISGMGGTAGAGGKVVIQ